MMSPTAALAQGLQPDQLQGLFKSVESALHPSGVGNPEVLLVVGFVGGIIAFLLVLAVMKSRRQEAVVHPAAGRPMRLMGRVLKEMGVAWPDRLLMRLIAGKIGIRQPAVMLFSPALFERHTQPWADSVRTSFLRQRVRARLKVVAARAFA